MITDLLLQIIIGTLTLLNACLPEWVVEYEEGLWHDVVSAGMSLNNVLPIAETLDCLKWTLWIVVIFLAWWVIQRFISWVADVLP